MRSAGLDASNSPNAGIRSSPLSAELQCAPLLGSLRPRPATHCSLQGAAFPTHFRTSAARDRGCWGLADPAAIEWLVLQAYPTLHNSKPSFIDAGT